MEQAIAPTAPIRQSSPVSGRSAHLLRLLRRDRLALLGLVILVGFVLIAIFAPLLAPHDPLAQNLRASRLPPAWQEGGSWEHPLGTDRLGRDLLSRILYGARVSLLVGFFGATLACLLGLAVGVLAGYLGGWVDALISGLVNLLLSIPYLVLVIVVAALVGRSLVNVILLFGITTAPLFARVVRGEVLRLRAMAFVEATVAIGTPPLRVLLRHIVPNLTGPLVTLATFEMSAMIFYEAGLGFLGLSVPPNVPSWGNLLSTGRESLMAGMPWLSLYPGLAIALTALGINLLGDWLRDATDPRMRR
ncbi:ABC transporter permease [Caldilinea sp.]|jgi:ABC-type dipeptide/oligopeptide/nickel transport system permease subunit|uniref:ABC transporter permease n=1 Tax=Caldilinea sp. TaxID=2293560 RepID=UPI002629B7C9|nr:ABC transporter permease [uncultured Caldilinea sp.]